MTLLAWESISTCLFEIASQGDSVEVQFEGENGPDSLLTMNLKPDLIPNQGFTAFNMKLNHDNFKNLKKGGIRESYREEHQHSSHTLQRIHRRHHPWQNS
ncbi:hypothetical protein N7508_007008 [Penicillium antarcticum]|uniref:uncharacterized protein n=1 Tax=Penicillium antarcticum TaxID=416450 RepID=UPI00238AE9E5|nr:uncharacterized protein N7508_007008 [Penicillium antarcticum]KAJ5302145.1 hypothetical protein N7508_007008 [Penicillium antarcticum]